MAQSLSPMLRSLILLAVVVALAVWMYLGGGSSSGGGDSMVALKALETSLAEGRFGAVAKGLRDLPPASLPDGAARLRYGRVAMEVADPVTAAAAVQGDAVGDPVATRDVRMLLAEALIRSGRPEAAQRELAELEKAGLKDEEWHYRYALLALLRGEKGVAREHLEPLIRERTRMGGAHVLWADQVRDYAPEVEKRLVEGLAVASDPGIVHRALGRHFLSVGRFDRALPQLEEAVRFRPWDREARMDLVRARRFLGRERFPAAEEEARALVAEDPAEPAHRILLAETLAAWALADADRGRTRMDEATALYEALAVAPPQDREQRMRIHLGLARAHVEQVDEDAEPGAPGTHLARVDAALDAAEACDPRGLFRDAYGVRLGAEAAYLRGRAYKRAHVKDDTVAVGLYETAVKRDDRHLEATWDLALLYYDFMRKSRYQRMAAVMFLRHIKERERRGLPPLDPDRLRMVWHCWKIVSERRDRGDTELTPPDQKEVPPPSMLPGAEPVPMPEGPR